MPDKREEILYNIFDPESNDCRTRKQDIEYAIRLNPDVDKIYNAMDEHGKQMCLDLLEYMAKNKVDVDCDYPDNKNVFYHKGEWITAEQLFENFL